MDPGLIDRTIEFLQGGGESIEPPQGAETEQDDI